MKKSVAMWKHSLLEELTRHAKRSARVYHHARAEAARVGRRSERPSIFLIGFFATMMSLQPGPSGQVGARTDDPDVLFANRSDVASARRAADLWAGALQRNPGDFDTAWKLARADYWLGGHVPQSERKTFLEHGIDAGRAAASLRPGRAEGHFWMAANMGALAEGFGLGAGARYRTPIKQALETVLRIDPAFQQGSADRALGRWYFKVPALLGGSTRRAEEHLRASLTYNPNSTASHFFLAELLFSQHRDPEARTELQHVLDAPIDPDWVPEDQEFKQKATALLSKRSH
jgi:TRAP transporter T-component